jgi:hypothetical protein
VRVLAAKPKTQHSEHRTGISANVRYGPLGSIGDMTYLKVIMPDESTAELLERDILSTVCKELGRFNYEPTGDVSAAGEANNVSLHPQGHVQIDPKGATRIVRVHASDVDLHDLFTAVLADLEQRNVGLTGEID